MNTEIIKVLAACKDDNDPENVMPFQQFPFNGDKFIQQEFLKLKEKFNITTFIETGTCLGFSTEWAADNFDQVYTMEIDPTFVRLARKRLISKKNVKAECGNSVNVLPYVLSQCDNKTIIFLDAHWYDYNPLKDELRVISQRGIRPIIAIHDFYVPGSTSLGFDTYHEQAFTFEWLKESFDEVYGINNYSYYYNSDSTAEGAYRGIIYLIPNDNWISQISNAPAIQQHSQYGEEGFLKFILDNIKPENKFIVDLGAGNGLELSNSAYFIEHCGYSGLLIDGDNKGHESVKQEWITKENILEVLSKYNCPKDFALLSFDLDGNDYDILSEMLTVYSPKLIICEINGTIPLYTSKKMSYNAQHVWNNDDYYGFSFAAAYKLAEKTGYKLIHQNNSLNAYMVKKDFLIDPEMYIEIPFEHIQYHPHNSTSKWDNV